MKQEIIPTFDPKADPERNVNFAMLATAIIERAEKDLRKTDKNSVEHKSSEQFLQSEWCENLKKYVSLVYKNQERKVNAYNVIRK